MDHKSITVKQNVKMKICKIPMKIQPLMKKKIAFHKSDATLENEYIKRKKMKKGEVFMIKGGWWF